MRYTVVARMIWRTAEGWDTSDGIPTFELCGNTLGLVDVLHAAQVAHSMLRAINPDRLFSIGVTDERSAYASISDM
jgi:hypothetical protein